MRHSSASSSSYSPPPIHIYNNHIIPSHALPGVHGGASENGHSSTYVTREDLSKFQNDLYTGISGAQYKTKTEKLSIFRKIFILLTTALGAFAVYIYYNGIPPSLNKYIKVTVKKSGSGPPTPSSMIGGNKQVGQVIQNTGKYFDDVKGIDECKEELVDIVDFLKHPEKYEKFGARIPRGVLLVGPPGTGKTLLAKAVAQEAGVQFVSACGSEFDQAFVGMGASRVRDLFKMIPPGEKGVIFIDEIDSIARSRTASRSYHQQTLNELLTQMDGFTTNRNVIVIGATNTAVNELDTALMRPGRFDKTIEVPLPDSYGRREIVEYYLEKTKHRPNINLDTLARSTVGMTGAEIENCVNQAAIHAVRRGREMVVMEDLDFGIDRQRMGVELTKRDVHEEDRRITAYHEAGHALVSHLLGTELNRVHKITIIPRGAAGGYTSFIPSSDVELMPSYQIIKHIKTAFGGRVAEEIILGLDNVTAGASGDLEQATNLARHMVTTQGMSNLGTLIYDPQHLGEDTMEKVDMEILSILQDCRSAVREMLNEPHNKHALDRIAQALLKHETISGDEMASLLEGREIERDDEGIRFTSPVPSVESHGEGEKVPLPNPTPATSQQSTHRSEGL
eukprot:CAMPEP_0117442038 /NCGR_PEP_ID=MMETSP0759-20121206/3942_1 /TAXON_ID=63605 /ORGANISM="Percolomonas cosmopolitus, Strain WS" /LENGTH=620 /DNA_ID=CAMNT_0005233907 /DNA_START=528 /DNA_END=2390 /DNA_ORIENTATION=+